MQRVFYINFTAKKDKMAACILFKNMLISWAAKGMVKLLSIVFRTELQILQYIYNIFIIYRVL